jgi:hypothetical protein
MILRFNWWRVPWLLIALVICTALLFSAGMLLEYVCPYCEGTAYNIGEGILLLGIGGFSLWTGYKIWGWIDNREWSLLWVLAISVFVAVIVFLGLVLGSGMR